MGVFMLHGQAAGGMEPGVRDGACQVRPDR
jgi:hypothetical protein